ncbi:polyprenyl synthetase family protein [Desulfobotulus mexicanus]|uniref:Polyprenyl synthetase family protein n=1 Tax=Desulfobotulus mexicanus TaxID=2586642 RepID=A0A5Q4VEM4_9BACT|nr:polyprenyl synthetase family protein [Desulfobotulus mexicanus]TYT76095.1 polyprenyl synthetase family protein [Desulfobotulus mexicanus]
MGSLKEKIVGAVAGDLSAIEKRLEANLAPELDLVREIAGHILFSGGKRLRPLLCLLMHRAFGGKHDLVLDVAGIFEFLHAATLIHDDVVDGAVLRRGKSAAHTLFGPAEAVLTGDFLLARSLNLAAATANPEIISVIARITEQMAQGEIEQLRNKGNLDLTEAAYDRVIERKTAVLIEGACKTGALLAGVNREDADAAALYGWELGMAFQMADDLLDYTEDEKGLGKLPGADLREGKATLPLICALRSADTETAAFIRNIAGTEFLAQDFDFVKRAVEKAGGMEMTRQRAMDHVASAKKAIEVLPAGAEKDLLGMLAEYALVRKQ